MSLTDDRLPCLSHVDLPTIGRMRKFSVAKGIDLADVYDMEPRESSAHELMAATAQACADLMPQAQAYRVRVRLLDGADQTASADLLRGVRLTAAAAARASWHALDAHGREVGYDTSPWTEHADHGTAAWLMPASDPGTPSPTLMTITRSVLSDTLAALRHSTVDRMAVPPALAGAIGGTVAVFMLASAALGRPFPFD